MLGYYKYSREDIAKKIKESPKTNDGYYYFKDFPKLNSQKSGPDGFNDIKYYYSRDIFSNKLVFNDFEIKCYLSKKEEIFDVERMLMLDNKLLETIDEFLIYELNEDIPNFEFNLNELIDTTIYLFNVKY